MPGNRAGYDVAVIGGGVIGCAAARALADAGLRVVVIDRGEPGREASAAAAGLLAPQYESEGTGDPFFDFCHRSRALYPDFVGALREETGIDSELRRDGMLVLPLTREEESDLEDRFERQRRAGLSVERIDRDRLQALEPLVNPDVAWALFLPEEAQVDNVRLCRALVRSLELRDVALRTGDPVLGVVVRDGRVRGLELASGERVQTDRVLLAAGAWSGTLAGLPRELPVRPARGQMLEFRGPRAPRRILAVPRGGYIVPRLDGRLIVGSTEEEVGFDPSVTAGGIADILGRALRLAPDLRHALLTAAWAGLRPGTPDGRPVLGSDPEIRGLLYATGHHRNGILLAPLTGQIVAELVRGHAPALDLEPFRPDRFAGG